MTKRRAFCLRGEEGRCRRRRRVGRIRVEETCGTRACGRRSRLANVFGRGRRNSNRRGRSFLSFLCLSFRLGCLPLLSLSFRSFPLLSFKTLSFNPQFLRSGPLSNFPFFFQLRFFLEFLLPVCLAHLHHRLSFQFLLLPFGKHLMWHPRAVIGTVRQTRRATNTGNEAISARGRRNSLRRGDLRRGEWVDRQTDT